jgi:hypothetical protein
LDILERRWRPIATRRGAIVRPKGVNIVNPEEGIPWSRKGPLRIARRFNVVSTPGSCNNDYF